MVSFQPANHWLYQLAYCLLLLSYVTTNILVLRLCICAASLCFGIWGWLILNYSLDTMIWNGLFVIINLYQAARLLIAMYPVKFDPDREALYEAFFAPGKYFMSRSDFKLLVDETPVKLTSVQQQHHLVKPTPNLHGATGRVTENGAHPSASPSKSVMQHLPSIGSSIQLARSASVATMAETKPLCCIRTYQKGDIICEVGDPSRTLSVLLSGRCLVEKIRRGYSYEMACQPEHAKIAWAPLNIIQKMDLLDSPEWAARATERPQVYEVRIRVLSSAGARVFEWNAPGLENLFKLKPNLESCINGIVGVDLARKVFSGNMERFAVGHEREGSTRAHGAGSGNQHSHGVIGSDGVVSGVGNFDHPRRFSIELQHLPLSQPSHNRQRSLDHEDLIDPLEAHQHHGLSPPLTEQDQMFDSFDSTPAMAAAASFHTPKQLVVPATYPDMHMTTSSDGHPLISGSTENQPGTSPSPPMNHPIAHAKHLTGYASFPRMTTSSLPFHESASSSSSSSTLPHPTKQALSHLVNFAQMATDHTQQHHQLLRATSEPAPTSHPPNRAPGCPHSDLAACTCHHQPDRSHMADAPIRFLGSSPLQPRCEESPTHGSFGSSRKQPPLESVATTATVSSSEYGSNATYASNLVPPPTATVNHDLSTTIFTQPITDTRTMQLSETTPDSIYNDPSAVHIHMLETDHEPGQI